MKIKVTITAKAGSAPRDAGTVMVVDETGQTGTIGGGALEFEATQIARGMLSTGKAATKHTFPLGPALGQCCGGSVTLAFQQITEDILESDGHPLWIYGAGHVGRALVDVLSPLPDFAITWVDTRLDRFPAERDGVTHLVAADPARAVQHAPQDADHLILTYSHDFDLAICHAVLTHGFRSAGVIGSATKWARFRSRLATLGHVPAEISRIACPIGNPTLGKHPQAIAIGVAMAMLAEPDSATARGTG